VSSLVDTGKGLAASTVTSRRLSAEWHAVRDSYLSKERSTAMRLNRILAVASVAALMIVTALPASAQSSFGFGFSHFGRHSGFGFGFSSYQPAPVYVQRCWVPAHYETVCEQVWVQGCSRRVWVEPAYQTFTDPAGNTRQALVREGYWNVVLDPGHYETRYVQVLVAGHYV
jgi:hypothetical protein